MVRLPCGIDTGLKLPDNAMAIDAYDSAMAKHTLAPVRLAQQLFKHLEAAQGCGVVVNLLDQKLWNMNPDFFSYTLSKAALETANTMLAQAFAPRVRVVGVAPGPTARNLTRSAPRPRRTS